MPVTCGTQHGRDGGRDAECEMEDVVGCTKWDGERGPEEEAWREPAVYAETKVDDTDLPQRGRRSKLKI